MGDPDFGSRRHSETEGLSRFRIKVREALKENRALESLESELRGITLEAPLQCLRTGRELHVRFARDPLLPANPRRLRLKLAQWGGGAETQESASGKIDDRGVV